MLPSESPALSVPETHTLSVPAGLMRPLLCAYAGQAQTKHTFWYMVSLNASAPAVTAQHRSTPRLRAHRQQSPRPANAGCAMDKHFAALLVLLPHKVMRCLHLH